MILIWWSTKTRHCCSSSFHLLASLNRSCIKAQSVLSDIKKTLFAYFYEHSIVRFSYTKLVTKPHHSCAHIQARAINKSQHYRMALIFPGLYVLYCHGLLTNKPSEDRSETWKYSNPDTDFHIRCKVSDSLPVLQLFLFCFGFFKHSFMDMRARQRLTTYILSFVTLQTFCMHKKLCKMLNGTLKMVKIDMAKQDISGLKQF